MTRARTPDGKQEVNHYHLQMPAEFQPSVKLQPGSQPGVNSDASRVSQPGVTSETVTVILEPSVKPPHLLTTFVSGTPALENPPEWLETLRLSTGYDIQSKEAALVEAVNKLGLSDDALMQTAEALASKWPVKGVKHLDFAFRNWLRRDMKRNGVSKGGEVQGVAPRGEMSGEDIRAYVARIKARGAYSPMPKREVNA